METTWTIKAMAKKTNISEDTIRYYEKEGLLRPKRSPNNYRQYTVADFTTLKYIAVMKYASFSLKEIKELVHLLNTPPSANCHLHSNQLLKKKKTDLEKMVIHYQMLVQLLNQVPIPESFDDYQEKELFTNETKDSFIDKIFYEIGGHSYENHQK